MKALTMALEQDKKLAKARKHGQNLIRERINWLNQKTHELQTWYPKIKDYLRFQDISEAIGRIASADRSSLAKARNGVRLARPPGFQGAFTACLPWYRPDS